MKYILLIFCTIFGTIHCNYDNPPYVSCMDEITKECICEISKSKGYGLYVIGGGAVDSIHLFVFGFQIKKTVDVDQAREIFLDIYDVLAKIVNKKKEGRPFFSKFPMDHDNLEIKLIFSREEKDAITYVSNFENRIFYHTSDPGVPTGYKTVLRESFEEAIAKVR